MFFVERTIEIADSYVVRPGLYLAVTTVYVSTNASDLVAATEYAHKGEGIVSVVDLTIFHSDGNMYLQSFSRLNDGSWVDANGKVSKNISDLLPNFLLSFIRLEAKFLGEVTVSDHG